MENYERFNKFLSTIDLDGQREKYKPIKTVEQNLPPEVQCLACIYAQYWEQRKGWVGFDDFYKIYKKSIPRTEFENLRKRWHYSEETFYKGLRARIYRTWASLITQVQGAYVAESIYGKGNVDMGVDIDHTGRDIVIDTGDTGRWPIQIRKETSRTDIPGSGVELKRFRNDPEKEYILLTYFVPKSGPKTPKTGEDSKPFADWKAKWGDRLEWLDNGFIVFKPKMFEKKNLLSTVMKID